MQYHPERIAVVVAGNGRMQRCYRSLSFPDIICGVGSPIPAGSLCHSSPHRPNIASDIAACSPDLWIDVKRDLRAPALFEQVYLQQNGFAMILLRLKLILEESTEKRRLEEGWRHSFHSGRWLARLRGRYVGDPGGDKAYTIALRPRSISHRDTHDGANQ